MATRASFQNLGQRLINDIFGDFRDPLVLTELGPWDHTTETSPVVSTATTNAIRLEYNKFQVDGQNIQQGDYRLIFPQADLTVDVRADNVTATFNSKSIDIINVTEDAARAVYTLQARDK